MLGAASVRDPAFVRCIEAVPYAPNQQPLERIVPYGTRKHCIKFTVATHLHSHTKMTFS